MDNLVIRDAIIKYRNFEGNEKPNNPKGIRNFCVVLDEDIATSLKDEGWNVKSREREEGDIEYFLPVAVRYDRIPPRLWLVTSTQKTLLDDISVKELDHAEFVKVDITISPSRWEVNGKTGIKAYIKSGFFTIREDELEMEYGDIPVSGEPRQQDEEELPFR